MVRKIKKIKIELSCFDCEVIESALLNFMSSLDSEQSDYVFNLSRRISFERFLTIGSLITRVNPFNETE